MICCTLHKVLINSVALLRKNFDDRFMQMPTEEDIQKWRRVSV